ncbi:MAG: hypothetical protein M3Y41_14885 [Pseudomonadota bacterium]|nr:hypothetical protein [Pseudomonadota bacterium]
MADVFALRNSSLNAFLYADVGTEANGCGLTILSVLARLGKDPWAEAALWSQKSKDAAVDALTQSIVLMQLRQPADEPARSTALRLIDLLPRGARSSDASASAGSKAASSVMPNGMWMIIGCAWIYLALSIGMGLAPRPNAAAVTMPATAQTNK